MTESLLLDLRPTGSYFFEIYWRVVGSASQQRVWVGLFLQVQHLGGSLRPFLPVLASFLTFWSCYVGTAGCALRTEEWKGKQTGLWRDFCTDPGTTQGPPKAKTDKAAVPPWSDFRNTSSPDPRHYTNTPDSCNISSGAKPFIPPIQMYSFLGEKAVAYSLWSKNEQYYPFPRAGLGFGGDARAGDRRVNGDPGRLCKRSK